MTADSDRYKAEVDSVNRSTFSEMDRATPPMSAEEMRAERNRCLRMASTLLSGSACAVQHNADRSDGYETRAAALARRLEQGETK